MKQNQLTSDNINIINLAFNDFIEKNDFKIIEYKVFKKDLGNIITKIKSEEFIIDIIRDRGDYYISLFFLCYLNESFDLFTIINFINNNNNIIKYNFFNNLDNYYEREVNQFNYLSKVLSKYLPVINEKFLKSTFDLKIKELRNYIEKKNIEAMEYFNQLSKG